MSWLGLIVLLLIGPAALLAAGAGAIPWVLTILTGVAVCLRLSRIAYGRYPDSEVFLVPLIPAAVLWFGSPFLLAAFAI